MLTWKLPISLKMGIPWKSKYSRSQSGQTVTPYQMPIFLHTLSGEVYVTDSQKNSPVWLRSPDRSLGEKPELNISVVLVKTWLKCAQLPEQLMWYKNPYELE